MCLGFVRCCCLYKEFYCSKWEQDWALSTTRDSIKAVCTLSWRCYPHNTKWLVFNWCLSDCPFRNFHLGQHNGVCAVRIAGCPLLYRRNSLTPLTKNKGRNKVYRNDQGSRPPFFKLRWTVHPEPRTSNTRWRMLSGNRVGADLSRSTTNPMFPPSFSVKGAST